MAKKKTKKETSAISYTGKVKIQLLHGNKIYKTINGKNSGSIELFKFLAHALINQYEPMERPKFLMLYYATLSSDEAVTTSATPHNAVRIETGTDEEIGAYCDAIFEFLVPYGSLSGQNVNRLRIFNSNTVDIADPTAASVTVDLGANEFTISDNKTNILITWTMRISNMKS